MKNIRNGWVTFKKNFGITLFIEERKKKKQKESSSKLLVLFLFCAWIQKKKDYKLFNSKNFAIEAVGPKEKDIYEVCGKPNITLSKAHEGK